MKNIKHLNKKNLNATLAFSVGLMWPKLKTLLGAVYKRRP